jgi:NAD(P)H-flavin reductase
MLSPSVRSLVFEIMGARPLVYEPGQAIDLFVPTASGLANKRAYSIASAPGFAGERHIELAVTRVPDGPTSAALHHAVEGDAFEADRPRGALVRWPAERDRSGLFVATGSGLAPLRAILQAELARSEGPRVELLFGCRTRADILWGDELAEWSRAFPRFSLAVTLSRPDPEWTGLTGHVQAHVANRFAALQPERAYVCGLSPMVESVVEALGRAGLARGSVRTEEYDT